MAYRGRSLSCLILGDWQSRFRVSNPKRDRHCVVTLANHWWDSKERIAASCSTDGSALTTKSGGSVAVGSCLDDIQVSQKDPMRGKLDQVNKVCLK